MREADLCQQGKVNCGLITLEAMMGIGKKTPEHRRERFLEVHVDCVAEEMSRTP